MFVDSVDRGAAEAIADRLEGATATMAVTQIRVLGGAMARVDPAATAFAHRRSRIMVNVAASEPKSGTGYPRSRLATTRTTCFG